MHFQITVSLKTPFKNVHIRNLPNLSSKKVSYTQYYLCFDQNLWKLVNLFWKNTFLPIHFIFENQATKNWKMIIIKTERFNGL